MRRWTLATVAALVVLAGCNTTLQATETPTVSPAPVPEDPIGAPTPTPPAAALPPGVTPSGIENTSALARAHRAALVDRSYQVVVVTNESTGEHWAHERRVARVHNRTVYLLWQTRTTRENRTERVVYADGRERFTRCETAACPSGPIDSVGDDTGGTVLGLLSGANSSVDGTVRRDGRVHYRLVVTGSPFGIGSPYGVIEVTNYTATALVAPSGLVSDLRARYDLSQGGRTVHVTTHLRYTDVGTTRVTPPSWSRSRSNATTG